LTKNFWSRFPQARGKGILYLIGGSKRKDAEGRSGGVGREKRGNSEAGAGPGTSRGEIILFVEGG